MENKQLFYASSWVFTLGKGIIIFALVIALVHFFIITIFRVTGASMEPNFTDGEYILANRINYYLATPVRGDVAILRFPGDPEHKKYIKRVIGLPNERLQIKEGLVYINDKQLLETYLEPGLITAPNQDILLGNDEYFVMGDNRTKSSDSRNWGVCSSKDFIGRAFFRLNPLDRAGLLERAFYPN